MEQKLSAKDILIDVNKILGGLRLPVSEMETIIEPIKRCRYGIQLVIDAMEKSETEHHDVQESVEESEEELRTEEQEDA